MKTSKLTSLLILAALPGAAVAVPGDLQIDCHYSLGSILEGTVPDFDQLRDVFARYGLDMDREVARKRAVNTRIENGWQGTDSEPGEEDAEPALRLVGSERA